MAKKKKKGRGTKVMKPMPKAQNPAAVLDEQKQVLSELRGRRAETLGERIFADASVEESVRLAALAVGQEAYLRELLSNGHVEQARGKAAKLLKDEPRLAERWALSLLLRLGLVKPLPEDSEWMARLRAELVDPEDLLGVEGLGAEAQAVLDAWALVEQNRDAEALDQLRSVGRRSALVDWRLFLQALMAARRGDFSEAESVCGRMLEGSPAHCAAQTLLSERTEGSGPVTRRLKALEGRLVNGKLKLTDYTALQTLVQWLLSENRPGLAGALVVTFADQITSQQGANRYWALFERMFTPAFSLQRIYIRHAMTDYPHEGLLHPEIMSELRRVAWSASELECVWVEFFYQVRNRWKKIESEYYPEELEDAREDLLVPLFKDCRRLVQKLPACREIYEFWIWLERQCGVRGNEALKAFVAAFDDPEVLERAAIFFTNQNDFENAEACLARLPESNAKEKLRHSLVVFQMMSAFRDGQTAEVEALAAGYSGSKLSEQIAVAFMRWHGAAREDKRKLGQVLIDFNLPWLVFFTGATCDRSLTVSKLPAGLKRSLAEDSEAVLKGYLKLLELGEPTALRLNDSKFTEPLCKAAEDPAVSISVLRPFLLTVLLRVDDPEQFVWESETGLTMALKTLLSGEPDDQALAIVLRFMTLYLDDWEVDADKSERSFRVAWTLAGAETRRTILRIYSKCGFERKNFPEKPASQKMIDAELKMQRKFSRFEQAEERYGIEEAFNPFEGDDPFGEFDPEEDFDPIEILERMKEEDPEALEKLTAILEAEEDELEFESKPYKFGKYPPTMELEFDGLIDDIRDTTRGEHRLAAADRVEEMVKASTLTKNEKARLTKKVNDLRKGA